MYFSYGGEDGPVDGRRPPCLVEPPGALDKFQRRTVEPIVGTFVPVPILDVPVPHMVDQLVDVLKIIDISQPALAEQVIEVPKINLQDTIPQRSVLGVPQLAEQLVEVPTVVSQSFFQEHFVKQNVPWCVGWWRPSRLTGFNSTSWYDFSWFDCDCWYVFSRTGFNSAPWSS